MVINVSYYYKLEITQEFRAAKVNNLNATYTFRRTIKASHMKLLRRTLGSVLPKQVDQKNTLN